MLKHAKETISDITTESKLYVFYNNKFVKVTSGSDIPVGRNYLDLSGVSGAGTRGFYNIGDGEDGTTGISEVKRLLTAAGMTSRVAASLRSLRSLASISSMVRRS